MSFDFERDKALLKEHPALVSIALSLRKRPDERKYYSARLLEMVDAILSGLDESGKELSQTDPD